MNSGARVRLDSRGRVIVETDMTDIGTGSYTVIAQTAAEMMGVRLEHVSVRLGDSNFPGVLRLRRPMGRQQRDRRRLRGLPEAARSGGAEGGVERQPTPSSRMATSASDRAACPSAKSPAQQGLVAEDSIEFGDLNKQFEQATFGAHFVEVGVDAATGETRVRRMLAVCAAGRILNPKTARSQVIGGMTMGVGAALMEELAVDTRMGLFVNHDLAGYEVPVHADIPHQEVIFLDETDPISSPMKAKGVGELGICGTAAAVANAVYNATGVRVRDYPITLDKLLNGLPML